MAPNQHQQQKLVQLQNELGLTQALPILGESDGYVFTAVNGVTVVITRKSSPSPRGGFKVPCVRRYGQGLDAAANARNLWAKQNGRDKANPSAGSYVTGHFGSVVGTDWYCDDSSCPCRVESHTRRKDRSLRG
jgi:hypothetical protein